MHGCQKAFKRQQKFRRSTFVFPAGYTDSSFIGLPRVLIRALNLVNIEGVSVHTLRHTYAGIAAVLGFCELTIASRLGHASTGVTQRYIHIDEALVMAANKVSEWIKQLL